MYYMAVGEREIIICVALKICSLSARDIHYTVVTVASILST